MTVNREQMYRKYKKKRILTSDILANIEWEVKSVEDDKDLVLKEIDMSGLTSLELSRVRQELTKAQ